MPDIHLHFPTWSGDAVFGLLGSSLGWQFLSVILPMGLFNIIGSLQCLESAEAAGDRYPTRPSLLANGVGSIVAACLGSPFATTIYIGHPGWKDMGARWGYSVINGIVIAALGLLGAVSLVLHVMPIEVALGILLWIGIVITAQAFQASDQKHALAVAIGLVPGLAAWALMLVESAVRATGGSLQQHLTALSFPPLHINGIIPLQQGFMLSSIIYAAVVAFVIDLQFTRAACWLLAAAVLSALGLIHAYTLSAAGVENKLGWMAAPEFFAVYLVAAVILWALGRRIGGKA
jgi:AGZA family xanthine/uracil permease-like MFS transporter